MRDKRQPVSIGIVGCGNVLEAYMPQIVNLQRQNLAEASLACGRPHQEARALALGVHRFVDDELVLLKHQQVEVVLILASMPEHARLARVALEAGKHVVLEKPLAIDLKEARELIQFARQMQRHLVCAPFTILSPTFRQIALRIQSHDIGKPCLARARYGWAGPWWSEWFYKPGGGCIFDLGVYCITTLTGLLGPVRRVMAMTGVAIPEREINGRVVKVEAEDNAQITLDFGNSLFATVMTGFTMQQYRTPAVEIYGTTGSIQMLGDDWDPDGYELWQNATGCWQVFKETTPDWSWTDGLRHTIECLHNGTTPTVTPEHAYHVLEILLKAQQSGREGRAIYIESEFIQPEIQAPVASEAAHLMHDRTREHIAPSNSTLQGAS